MKKNLNQFVVGESGVVSSVKADGAIKRRLYDMGLTSGAPVSLVKVSPLGDPLELNVRGYALSIRRSEAQCIEMETEQ